MPGREDNVVLADAAISDIRDIYDHIASVNSIAVADNVYRLIREAIDRIGHHPESGALREHIRQGHRIVPVSSWIIWYREQDTGHGVLILRVLHGHMDANRHLLK